MINNLILAGKIKSKDLQENYFTLKVKRSYKNNKGFFDYDEIICFLWNGFVKESLSYYKENEIVIIKGRIEVDEKMIVVAERIETLKKAN